MKNGFLWSPRTVSGLYLHYTPEREFVNTVSLRFPEKKTEKPGEQNGTVRTCRMNQFLSHAEMRRRGVFMLNRSQILRVSAAPREFKKVMHVTCLPAHFNDCEDFSITF